MPSLGAFLRRAKSKKSPSETVSSPPKQPEKRRSSPLPPQLQLQRTKNKTSSSSSNVFRKKDKKVLGGVNDLDVSETLRKSDAVEESGIQHSQQALSSQSQPANNDSMTFGVNSLNSPISDTPKLSTISCDVVSGENAFNTSSQSPRSPSTSPIPESRSPNVTDHKPSFLILPSPSASFDTFTVNIDFTKFETTKVEALTRPHAPSPKRITNHDFLFLVDDTPGIDHRAWDTVCDIVTGVVKRLIPLAAKDSSNIDYLPPETPTISVHFIYSSRFIAHVQNLNQICSIFNRVYPREVPKYYNRHPHPIQKLTTVNTPPLRTLEHYFWNIYNEKLQKNAWIGQNPTTIILFGLSPLGNRSEDMDIFVAKGAEILNSNQIPLQLISIMVVQCNADPAIHRQLGDTRRMIASEWYTPRGKLPSFMATGGNGMLPVRRSMLNPYIPEQRRRPQRDWVDIITCGDWERAGGASAICDMIEGEVQGGIHRRKKLQREVATNYLTRLGKENFPQIRQDTVRFNDHANVEYEIPNHGESWPAEKFHGTMERQIEIERSPDTHHDRAAVSLAIINNGRIDYYD